MSGCRSAALRRRWADPAYRERQTEANRRAAAKMRGVYADPMARALLGQQIKASYRRKKKARVK